MASVFPTESCEELVRRSGIFSGFPYYVCRYTDLLVWCCDMLKLKAPVRELVDPKGMIDMVICHLEAFLHISGSRLRLLQIVSVFLIIWITGRRQLFKDLFL
jgi:hypothetical protein